MLPALIWSMIGAIIMTISEILVIIGYVALKKSDHLTPEQQVYLDYLNYAFVPLTIFAVLGTGKFQIATTKPFPIELIHCFFSLYICSTFFLLLVRSLCLVQ